MAYSDREVWDHIDAQLDGCKHYVELQIAGSPGPVRVKRLTAFDDDGFIVVKIDGEREMAIKASSVVSILQC